MTSHLDTFVYVRLVAAMLSFVSYGLLYGIVMSSFVSYGLWYGIVYRMVYPFGHRHVIIRINRIVDHQVSDYSSETTIFVRYMDLSMQVLLE